MENPGYHTRALLFSLIPLPQGDRVNKFSCKLRFEGSLHPMLRRGA